jgi:hypothetical protein
MSLPKTIDECSLIYTEKHGSLPKAAPCDDEFQWGLQYAKIMEQVVADVLNGDWVPTKEEEGVVIKMWPKKGGEYYLTTLEPINHSQHALMKSECYTSGVMFKSPDIADYAANSILGYQLLLLSRGLVKRPFGLQ